MFPGLSTGGGAVQSSSASAAESGTSEFNIAPSLQFSQKPQVMQWVAGAVVIVVALVILKRI